MTKKESIIAFDFGTSNCKAVGFDTEGRVVYEAAAPNEVAYAEGGAYLQEVRTWRGIVKKLVSGASASLSKTSLRAASVTGQGSFPVCLDEKGRVVQPTVGHLDKRPVPHAKRLFDEFGTLAYPELKIFSTLYWMKESHPERFKSIRSVMDAKEYVAYLLTGEVTYDPKGLPSLEKLSRFIGLDPTAFGEPRSYFEPVGELRRGFGARLGRIVPVEVGPNDGLCSALGSGATRRGTLADLSGTTEVMAARVPSDSAAVVAKDVFPEVSFFYRSAPFGIIFEWYRTHFYGRPRSAYAAIEREARSVQAGADGARFIIDSKVANYSYEATWGFSGLRLGHTRRHLARAVYECFAMALAKEAAFLRNCGIEVERIVASGGGARPATLLQMKADLAGVRVDVPQTLNTTSLGSAMLGAVSVGIYSDLNLASDTMLSVTRRVNPSPEGRAAYATVMRDWDEQQASN